MQRSPTFLIPLSHAFGDPAEPGFLLHRITFWKNGERPRHGKLGIEDFGAENMNIKRLLEAKAGNLATFALGQSYLPHASADPPAAATREAGMTAPDIFSPEFAQDPYPSYRIMRDEFPLYFHPGANAYVLSRYDDVREALTNPEFTTRSYAAQIEPLLGVTVVQLDGRDHARQRRLLAAPFRADRFQSEFAAGDRTHWRTGLIAGFRDRGEVELIGDFITPFSVGALATVVGLPQSDIDRFREVVHGAVAVRDQPDRRPRGDARRLCRPRRVGRLSASVGRPNADVPPAPGCCPCWPMPKSRGSN